MRVPKECRIEGCVATTGSSYRYVFLDCDTGMRNKGYLLATEGHLLVQLPVELDEGDVQGLVPPEAFTRARKLASGRDEMVVRCPAEWIQLADGAMLPRPTVGGFPDWRSVFRASSARRGAIRIAPGYLQQVVNALGIPKHGCVEISLDPVDGDAPLTIRNPDAPAAIGLLMPRSADLAVDEEEEVIRGLRKQVAELQQRLANVGVPAAKDPGELREARSEARSEDLEELREARRDLEELRAALAEARQARDEALDQRDEALDELADLRQDALDAEAAERAAFVRCALAYAKDPSVPAAWQSWARRAAKAVTARSAA